MQQLTEKQAKALLLELIADIDASRQLAGALARAKLQHHTTPQSTGYLSGVEVTPHKEGPYPRGVSVHCPTKSELLRNLALYIEQELTRDANAMRQGLERDEIQQHRSEWGHGRGFTVQGAPRAHIGMRGAGVLKTDAGKRWHGAETLQHARYAGGKDRPLPDNPQRLGRNGAPQVACRRGVLFKLQPPNRLRRKLRRLLPRVVAGTATPGMCHEVLESLFELTRYV
jgi:hypothetical protein